MEFGINKLKHAVWKRQPKAEPTEKILAMLENPELPPVLASELAYRQEQNPNIERERLAAELAAIRANTGEAVDAMLYSAAAGHEPTASLRLGIHAARVSRELVAQDPVFGTPETIRGDISREKGYWNAYDEITVPHAEREQPHPVLPEGHVLLPQNREVPITIPAFISAD